MDIEQVAWKAFILYGSIEAYLLHVSLIGLDKKNEDNQWTGQKD